MTAQRAAQIFKALSIGMLLDLMATLAVGIILGMVFAVFFMIQGVPDVEVNDRIRLLASSPGWFAFSVVIGATISIVAGFVAANYLSFNIYPWLGLMGSLLALLSFVGIGADISTLLAMGLSLLTLFSVVLGGRLWEWSQR